jgi:hypothetical protein
MMYVSVLSAASVEELTVFSAEFKLFNIVI